MAFCLCQQFNLKKNGNLFVELYKKLGFNFSWKYLNATTVDKKRYSVFQYTMSEVSEEVELDGVLLKSDQSSTNVLPGKLYTVKFLENDPKLVTLKVLWSFKYSIPEEAFEKKLDDFSYQCQRVKIQNNSNLFVQFNNGLGFILSWQKEGKLKRKGKRYYQLYQFNISQKNRRLHLEDVQLKYKSSSWKMFPETNVTVEIFVDEPRWIELNVFWMCKMQYDKRQNYAQIAADLGLLPPEKEKSKKMVQFPTTTTVSRPEIPIQAANQSVFPKMGLPTFYPTHSATSPQTTVANQSVPKLDQESELNSPLSTLTDAFTSQKYSDIVFLTNDAKKVFAHRCILFSFSDIFTALFDQSLDAQIEIEVDFPETIVIRAIEYCYGKNDGIQNFEDGLIKFADKYAIKGLKKACLKSLKDQQLTTENVCKIVKIAFEQNYTLLKQKCLHFIASNKAKLGAEKLSKLSVEILVSAFLSA